MDALPENDVTVQKADNITIIVNLIIPGIITNKNIKSS